MAVIDWSTQPKNIRSGLSHGVLYPTSGPGVPWAGLISATENRIAPEAATVFLDGEEIGHNVRNAHYQLSLVCYDYPVEFAACLGERKYAPGFFLTGQPKERFGLSFKTYHTRDSIVEYHFVYDASAVEVSSPTSTDTETVTPKQHTFTVDTIPMTAATYFSPTAHYKAPIQINDARINDLERFLYGSPSRDPMLPTPQQIANILSTGGLT